jgi:hypothetical protein
LWSISKRRPKTYREAVFSGIDRLRTPFVYVRRRLRRAMNGS